MSNPPDEEERGLARQPTASPNPPTITTHSGIDPALFQKLLQVAEREAEVRLEELSVEKQGRADAHEYAKLALNAQVQDRKDTREHGKSERRDKMYFAGGAIIVFGVLMIILIQLGQVELAKQIATHFGALLAGVFGGYNYGVRKGKDKKESD